MLSKVTKIKFILLGTLQLQGYFMAKIVGVIFAY